MKRSVGAEQTSGLRRIANALGILVIVAVVAMVATFTITNHYAGFDQDYISRADTVRVLSQSIAKNASEAANGKTDAFSDLEKARNELEENIQILLKGNEASGLPPTEATSEAAANALNQVMRPWEDMHREAGIILERRDMVVSVNELAEDFRISIPGLQRDTTALARRLIDTNADQAQVHQTTRALVVSEQIGRQLGEMLRGGIGNITAAQRLGRSSHELGEILNVLENGGVIGEGEDAMQVARVSDAQARQIIEGLQTSYSRMRGEINTILDESPELYRVRDAADSIFRISNQVLQPAEHLREAYKANVDVRPIKAWYGFLFFALALICLVLRGIMIRRISTVEVEAKEAEKVRVDEQAKRNQEAILNLLDEIEGLKEGDLTVQATVGEEITGAIGDAFNDAIESLRSLVTTINETSVQVSSAAQQTQATAMHLAEASDHQAHQITAASAAVNEMAVSIDQVSKNASESAKVAQQSVDLALKGADTVNRTIEGMDAIREQIQETSKRIKRLGESSQEIGNIVELINDIADQTNILALNASIQAAMAGESGRGFAVVADEVQRLAERSGNATKQIEALVKTIQTDTNEAVISMEQSTAGVVSGARLAEDAGTALREIEGVSKQLAGLIQNISEAARQQANAAANISDTMNVIQEITSQTSAGTNETATSIGNLADLANDLRNSVAGFNLPE
ncbi:twitching motility protein PilJ [Alkalilimnicola ehrlichii]|uniref:Twitching motility protein PilJ n=1 Tax=Alkalilimnicola ehrlichii TaxID=351052 RepID=A0A3E0X1Z7_9GAMM|nr:methyl-accepting chemotaxis protein [Alkalilimnicola ehrlichii]RFA31212.1 twitching motility protein PilJ [Alkalilimnicola ehrlichii]RFA39507.1 twitching motility protein PilJ [Alkalilimnicola ehrlichii]